MSTQQSQPTDARARLAAHFQGDPTLHGRKWNALYEEGFIPWDRGSPNPALIDLLSERQDLLPQPTKTSRKKALVPGCGKGYDVMLLSAFGYDAYGLEISPNALEAARENERSSKGKGVYEVREGREKGLVKWLSGDFFTDEFLESVDWDGEKKFDLIYDYTFLSALPPSLRPAWSKRFTELLATDGRIVCLEFPTYKPPSTGGPPWALPPKVYLAHLSRPGEELPYGGDGDLQEEKLGEPSKSSLRRIAHFQPKRTHEIGYDADGKVTDWVSIWTHSNC